MNTYSLYGIKPGWVRYKLIMSVTTSEDAQALSLELQADEGYYDILITERRNSIIEILGIVPEPYLDQAGVINISREEAEIIGV